MDKSTRNIGGGAMTMKKQLRTKDMPGGTEAATTIR